jgi:hypothetical protein
MAEEWRRAVAALADPTRRAVYAGLILGAEVDIPSKKRETALAALEAAGLIARDGTVIDDAFKELLALEPAVTKTGIDRFIKDGRIEQYPARPGDRAEVLDWAAGQLLKKGETLTEREINERLDALTKDVATLRRYLVDAGLVVRDSAGAGYSLGTKLGT